MAEVAWGGPIISTIITLTHNAVIKPLSHISNAGDKVKDIVDELEQLQQLCRDINSRIQSDQESDRRRKATAVVQGWIDKVDEYEKDVKKIKSRYDQRGCLFCSTSCSFNCCSNYRTGKKAYKMLKKLKDLKDRGAFTVVTEVQLLPPAQVVSTESTVFGLDTYLKLALRYLKDGDHEVFGIWGTGGVGKTTLLKEIINSLDQGSLGFHPFILDVVASRGCTTKKIQDQIISQHKLGNNNVGDVRSQAAVITDFLNRKDFVLLLDDVWERLDLVEVGIPRPRRVENQQVANRWKVIVVSRNEAICSQMGAHKRIQVNCLSKEDAWHLFEKTVGEATIRSSHIQGIAKQVADECKELPLALVVIGRVMSSKTTPQEWRDALHWLKNSQQLSGTENELFSILKYSYDHLRDDTIRECFLCCSLWPEDYGIPKDELIECWMGHDLIKDFDDIIDAYRTGRSIIKTLQEASLLGTGYSQADWKITLKMHDVLRDMALSIACKHGADKNRWMVRAGLALEEAPNIATKWKEAHKISLMHNRIKGLPSTISSNCDNLSTLILKNNVYLHESGMLQFFLNLKYLDLSKLDYMDFFPAEVCKLVHLEYLNLSSSRRPINIPADIILLKNLKYFILRDGEVKSLPEGMISSLPKLLVLDVCCVWKLGSQESILNQLNDTKEVHLKAVGVNVSSVSDFQKIIRIPIKSLSIWSMEGETSLPLLSSNLLGTPNIRYNLQELTISYCRTNLEELLIEGNSPLESLECLRIQSQYHLKEIIWKAVDYEDLFPALTHIYIYACRELRHLTWVMHLPCLERLEILHCDNINKVIDAEVTVINEERQIIHSFSGLKVLSLSYLEKLTSICSSAFAFPALETLIIKKCPDLKKLPLSGNHPKLARILGENDWWEGLEWEDPGLKTSVQPLFRET